VETRIDHLIITGGGFIGSSLRKHFESGENPSLRVWTAGRTESENSITAIVEQNQLTNYGVILSGWSGVAASHSRDAQVQMQSLLDFEKQLNEVSSLRPSITVGFGSQIEKAGQNRLGPETLTSYAAAKIEARTLFEAAMQSSGLIGKWIYIYSVYGPEMDSGWLLPQLIRAGASNVPLSMGECAQKWGLLHISDFSTAIELILQKPDLFPFEIDLGGEASQTLRQLVLQVEDILGCRCATFEKKGPTPPDSVPDLAALRAAGWTQRVTLKQGLLDLKDMYA